jgi:type IV pilus assembly protein PilE
MKSILKKNRSGFTLLEVIIVIIIVGVLASLALPRFFSTVEYSRGTEAMTGLSVSRQSIERCYLMRSNYTGCNNYTLLDVNDPGTSPNAHFSYAVSTAATTYTIVATRNTLDGGDGASVIRLTFNGTTVTRSGTGPFGAVQ